RELRRDVRVGLRRLGRRQLRDERLVEERAEHAVTVLVIEARAGGDVEAAGRDRTGAVEADALVVERRKRVVLVQRDGQELRDQARRVRVDRVLIVVLREEEQARLPLQRRARPQLRRAGGARRDPDFLRELEVLLVVVAG